MPVERGVTRFIKEFERERYWICSSTGSIAADSICQQSVQQYKPILLSSPSSKTEFRTQTMSSKRRFNDERVAGLLGLAFDAEDGHKRITRGKNFLLAGGSDETHSLMRETIIKVNEQLDARGQSLRDVSPNELRDLINDAQP